jgi:hypothetical protein
LKDLGWNSKGGCCSEAIVSIRDSSRVVITGCVIAVVEQGY